MEPTNSRPVELVRTLCGFGIRSIGSGCVRALKEVLYAVEKASPHPRDLFRCVQLARHGFSTGILLIGTKRRSHNMRGNERPTDWTGGETEQEQIIEAVVQAVGSAAVLYGLVQAVYRKFALKYGGQ